MKLNQQRLDAVETAFFERQLTSIEARLYEVLFPDQLLLSILKIDSSDGMGAEQFIYRIYEKIGMAQIIAAYASGDLPSVSVTGSEFTGRFYSIGNKFDYSIQELRAASMANLPLEQWKADAAKLAHTQLWNQIAWFGDSAHNLQGLLTHPNITKGYAATVTGHTEWIWSGAANKSPDQILVDMGKPFRDIRTLSKGIEKAEILLIGIDRYGYINDTYRATNSDRTILEAFESSHPGVVVDAVPELDSALYDPVTGAVSAGINIMVALDNDPMKGGLKGPIPFEMFPPAISGMQYEIACHSRFGGFVARYPLAYNIVAGI